MTTKVEDQYKSMSDFEEILEDAVMAASTDREEEFVKKAKQNYDAYGGRMFWSEKQDRWLRSIAGAEDY